MKIIKMATEKEVPLGDGFTMPLVGFGTFMIKPEDTKAIVSEAIKAGYRHIDTAEGYNNEAEVGEAIKESGVPRNELFITTKIWPGHPGWGHTPKTYETSIAAGKESLKKLGLDYVDLYLIHAPFPKDERLDIWKAFVELKKQGLYRSIGVSNYGVKHLKEIEDAGLHMPEANQLEIHPYCVPTELLAYMRERKILPIAYSSLAPLTSWRTAESDWANGKRSISDEVKEKLSSSVISDAAKAVGVSEARLLLRWAVQQGWPVLPKTNKAERLVENMDLFSFVIPNEVMSNLEALNLQRPLAWNDGLDPTTVP